MKKSLLFIATALLIISCGTSQKSMDQTAPKAGMMQPVDPTPYAKSITSSELKEMLYTYASDEFEGRNTGDKGQKMAVDYLKQQYVSMNVPSALPNNYFQNVPLEKQKSPDVTISVNGADFKVYDDFVSYGSSTSQTIISDEIVYAGYGIDSDNYSDYSAIDVKDKVVLVREGEPKDQAGMYTITGTAEASKWSNGRQALSSKRDAAKTKGAKALFILDNAMFERYSAYYKAQDVSGESGRISLVNNKPEMLQFIIGEKLAIALYPKIMDDAKSQTLATKVSIDLTSKSDKLSSENVAAFIKGSEKPDEIIVISAHLDHEGIKNGEIYNGADDDGSGTVAVVEIAEAFKAAVDAGHGPKRSILFLHVTGEEKGLLGSQYYTDMSPIFPLKNTMVDLNIDMIGRTDPKREGDRNYVYLIGSDKLSTELHNISEEVNKKYANVVLDYKYNDENDPNRFYYRSDHYNFAKNNIPVIFYFNGTHADYHQPSDTPDKIEYDLLENRARLVFYTAWELANRENKIVVDVATP